jgi:hypothetical protein
MSRPLAISLVLPLLLAPLYAQRGSRQTARDLFHSEAGLIISPSDSRRSRFGAARKGVIAVMLGIRYRIWKLGGEKPEEWDPSGPFGPGDQIRLGVEINDTGYLYMVHRQPSGMWRRIFPDPEIERGTHFVRSGLTYAIPPEEGITVQLPDGGERFFLVLSREPIKDLEVLVGPPQPENTVSAAPPPEIPDSLVEKVHRMLNPKDLLVERAAGENAVYVVNRTGKPDSLVVVEIRPGSK